MSISARFSSQNSFRSLSVALILFSISSWNTSTAQDKNWPSWRGTSLTGVVEGAQPPTEWNEKKNIKWKIKVPGSGHSTPIIWGDRIYLTTAINTGEKGKSTPTARTQSQERDERRRRGGRRRGGFGRRSAPTEYHEFVVLCLNKKTGEEIWRKTANKAVPHEGHHRDHGYSSSSPVTDGKLLFVHFGSRGTYCYDLNGELKWSKDFGDMSTRNGFGEGTSPALHGDTLIINWDHEGQSFILALNKNTGDPIWKKERDEKTSWVTPVFVEAGGKTQVVVNGTNSAVAYDIKDGSTIWKCTGQTGNVIPTPVVGHGLIYLMSGFRGSKLQAVQYAKAKGDVTNSKAMAWDHSRGTSYVPSAILYGEKIYFFKGNTGVLSCLDAKTGKAVVSEKRIDGLRSVYASPVGANGKIYVVGRDGTTVVLDTKKDMEIVATNQLDEGIDASPAIVGNQIFLRSKGHLYCIEKK